MIRVDSRWRQLGMEAWTNHSHNALCFWGAHNREGGSLRASCPRTLQDLEMALNFMFPVPFWGKREVNDHCWEISHTMIKVEGSLLACQNFARSRTIIPEQTLCFQHASFRNGAKGCLRRKHVYGYLSKQRSKKPLYKKTQFCTYLLAALLKGWHRYP